MRRVLVVVPLFALITGVAWAFANVQEETKPKYEIKEVMGEAHKKGLLKKVVSGDASDEEKAKLLDYYIALFENTPPKGEAGSWAQKAGAALAGAAAVVLEQEGAEQKLKAAVNCGACHKEHRG